ncbi:hypothetical protein [Mycoplasmopsis columbinasalis]|uniref:Lipoprotein n=1 Tax=Mycoplasmopsis columbinasalis TaxID=114880 RepID=A0A449B9Q6_9BACT|nr:hypothetical protein [Mycoplasmopsis columbinasalis]VEU77913.1 Uncharacterised protein [Mycoplasmopsis columbinasalis]
MKKKAKLFCSISLPAIAFSVVSVSCQNSNIKLNSALSEPLTAENIVADKKVTTQAATIDSIKAYLNKNFKPNFQYVNDKVTINDYWRTKKMIKPVYGVSTFELVIENNKKFEHFLFDLDSIYFDKEIDANKTTSEQNNELKTNRVFSYRVYFKNSNKWYMINNFSYQYKVPVTINLGNPAESSTKINPQILREIKDIDWDASKQSWVEAEILAWADGDTISDFKIISEPDKSVKSGLWDLWKEDSSNERKPDSGSRKIRLINIDTPEKAVDKTIAPPFEFQYAKKATDFAESNFGPGQKYNRGRIWFTGDKDKYNRWTAEFFFGDKFQYAYSVEILNHGWTLPFNEETAPVANLHNFESNKYTLLPAANAFNSAIANRRGMFHDFPHPAGAANAIYRLKPSSDYERFLPTNENNIFEYNSVKPEYSDPIAGIKYKE